MSIFSRTSSLIVGALVLAALLGGGPADAAGLRFTDGPKVLTEKPVAGEPVAFTATAVFPGEEWIGFQWDFGDGQPVGGISYQATVTSEPSHTFTEPGRHKVICTAYHGFKSGVFGVLPWKFRTSRSLTVEVAPSLPLTIGVLTVDGDEIEILDKKLTQFRITGSTRINGSLVLGNPVLVDLKKRTVTISGALTLPGAGDYAGGFSFFENVALDATTGGFAAVDLPKLTAQFEVAGFAAKVENVKIVGPGIELDFEIRIPRLTQDPEDPEEPPEPGAPIDLSKIFPPAPTPKQLAALSFKQFRIDTVSPYLHPLGESKATISNVPLGIAGTKFGIETLEAGVDPSQKRYFGTLKLKLPTDRGIGGTFEIREGQWEKVGFTLDGKLPFWTFTGVLDAIYIKTLSATIVNLAVLEGQPARVVTIQAGVFDPGSGTVSEPGVVFEWGPSTNLVGQNIVTPIRLTGACTFDPFWNVSAAGQLSFFEDILGERMRILGAQGSYAAPQDGREGGVWTFRGDLVFDPLFSLSAQCTTSFAPGDFHATASASGDTLLPSDHWISGIVPNVSGNVTWVWRLDPHAVNRITFHGYADVPSTYPVLRHILQNKGIGFSYDFATGEYGWQVIDVHTVVVSGPGKAESRAGIVADGAGADGLVVTLLHEGGVAPLSLRMPDGTLLTAADDDDTDVDYIAATGRTLYVLRSAPDGTYTAEFDDATLGAWDVQFFTPLALPSVSVDGITADTSVGRYETLVVPFTATGVEADATVRVRLDDDDAPGGGVLVATGTVEDGSLEADVAAAPAGEYRLVVEALGSDGMPVVGEAAGRVTVRDHLAVVVARGSIVDLPKAGRDKMSMSGTFTFDGPRPDRLFDHETETLRLTLGGDGDPYLLRIGPGDPGWRANAKGKLSWKSARGRTPVVALTLDPVKGRFKVKMSRAQFSVPPSNPIHFDLVFGDDAASDTTDWTQVAPGRLVR